MAFVRQRGNRWQCIVKRAGFPLKSRTFDLKKDAEKWGRQEERLMDTGHWIDPGIAQRTTIGDLLTRYASEVSIKKRGYKAEAYVIRQFMRSRLSQYSPATITSPIIAAWRDERLNAVSTGTVLREMQLLNHLFSVAMKEWGIALPVNPVSLVKRPSPGTPRDQVLTDTQRVRLIDACRQCQNPWVLPVVIFALETAARRGEILSLTWRDVDLGRSFARVSGKTGPRKLPLSSSCVAMLRELPRDDSGMVFPVSEYALRHAYQHATGRAKIKDFTFHDLRHDALTRLSKQGLTVLELRAVSGHTTTQMLQRYVSIDASDLAKKLTGLSTPLRASPRPGT